MNWKEAKTIYMESLDRLGAKGWKHAMEGFDELEKELKNRFPEAIANPLVLADIFWENIRPKFYDASAKKFLVSRKCFDALSRMRRILEPASRKAHSEWREQCHEKNKGGRNFFF